MVCKLYFNKATFKKKEKTAQQAKTPILREACFQSLHLCEQRILGGSQQLTGKAGPSP